MVEEVISRFSGVAESITSELSRRCLIKEEDEAIVAEFIRRTVTRFILKTSGLTVVDVVRILGVSRNIAQRLLKGTHTLTPEYLKKLSA